MVHDNKFKHILHTLTFEENNINNIFWEQNPMDQYFDLEILDIPKHNFDPKTPINIIKNDLKNWEDKFIVTHLNSRSLNKKYCRVKRNHGKCDVRCHLYLRKLA